jgi:hypothetical protein
VNLGSLRCYYEPTFDSTGGNWVSGTGRLRFDAPDSLSRGSFFRLANSRVEVTTTAPSVAGHLFNFDTLSQGYTGVDIRTSGGTPADLVQGPVVRVPGSVSIAGAPEKTFSLPLAPGVDPLGLWGRIGPAVNDIQVTFERFYFGGDGTSSSAPTQPSIGFGVDCRPTIGQGPVLVTIPVHGSAVTSVSPATGTALVPRWVTIRGTGFTGATGVTFSQTIKALAYRVESSTVISALTPALAPGRYPVYVGLGASRSAGPPAAGEFVVKPW